MDIISIAYGMLAVSVVVIVGSMIYLKRSQKMVEKACMYGIISAIMVQVFAFFFIFTGDFLAILVNAFFLGVVSYNMITVFGMRSAKIYEKDSRNFISFFVGNAVVANAVNFLLIGFMSISFTKYSQDPEFVSAVGEDMMNQMSQVMRSITVDRLGSLFVGTIASIIVSYCAIRIMIKAYHLKKPVLNLKSVLIMFVFYVINLYMPYTGMQEWMQLVLYGAVAFASYIFLKQEEAAKPAAR